LSTPDTYLCLQLLRLACDGVLLSHELGVLVLDHHLQLVVALLQLTIGSLKGVELAKACAEFVNSVLQGGVLLLAAFPAQVHTEESTAE
jgi:hypothetical protein